jgi:aryl-alcohol dehydrogenase-like predicted oxidoreductase
MRYQTFGRRTGLRVSEYALGTATFGPASTGAGPEAARQIFEGFVAAGGTTFDSSSRYQGGQAETMLGELLGHDRDDFVVITKYSGTVAGSRHGTTGNGRKVMIRSVEASLRRLNTDYVDVFMPHFPDGVTGMDEILAGLDQLVRSGKILHGALSNFPAWRVAGAAVAADLRGLAPLAGLQTEYSLAERSGERELLPMAEAHGLAVLLYSPLAGGLLTGKYRQGEPGRLSARGPVLEGPATAVVDAVLKIAAELGSSPVRVSLAWLRRRSARSATALIPIVGPRTVAQLDEYLLSLDLELSAEHYQLLDEVSAPVPGTPHRDVAAALAGGLDGDRTLLDAPPIPVI